MLNRAVAGSLARDAEDGVEHGVLGFQDGVLGPESEEREGQVHVEWG